jgi:hypothetical protein
MFIGYLSSFFIALLLSFFYLSYAAFGVFEQINEARKKEINTEIIEGSSGVVSTDNVFVFDYLSDFSEQCHQIIIGGFTVDIPLINDDIPLQNICLSEYFQRPPPAL